MCIRDSHESHDQLDYAVQYLEFLNAHKTNSCSIGSIAFASSVLCEYVGTGKPSSWHDKVSTFKISSISNRAVLNEKYYIDVYKRQLSNCGITLMLCLELLIIDFEDKR